MKPKSSALIIVIALSAIYATSSTHSLIIPPARSQTKSRGTRIKSTKPAERLTNGSQQTQPDQSLIQSKPELIVEKGHSDVVDSIAFSPDGKLIASASRDNTIKIWEVSTGTEIRTFAGFHSSVAFSPDGQTLATTARRMTTSGRMIELRDVNSGKVLQSFGHPKGKVNRFVMSGVMPHDEVNHVVFSPDGRLLASASEDKTIKIWDVATGKEVRTLEGHSCVVNSVAFSPDGKTLASAGGILPALAKIKGPDCDDNSIKLWDVSTGKELRTLRGHSSYVTSVAFSPDGKGLATVATDGVAKLWDVITGREILAIREQSRVPNTVAFSIDGRMLGTDGYEGIKLWDTSTGKEMRTLTGHSERVGTIAFSPAGKILASGSGDHTIKLWEIDSGKELRTLKGHSNAINSIAISSDAKLLASGGFDTTIRVWDLSTGRDPIILTGHKNSINSVVFSPDGNFIASGSRDNTIKLWDAGNGKEIRTLEDYERKQFFAGSQDEISQAYGSGDSLITLVVGKEKGEERRILKGHDHSVWSAAFTPDGKVLASASKDKTIKLWDVATGDELRTLKGHSDEVLSVDFSLDGQVLASASKDKTIRLWDATSGKETKTFVEDSSVCSVAFAPGSNSLAAGTDSGVIKLIDVSVGRELRVFTGHLGSVNHIAFSPDGGVLASGSADNVIKLWQTNTGKELRTITGNIKPISGVGFSEDGKHLFVVSEDDNFKVWEVDTGKQERDSISDKGQIRHSLAGRFANEVFSLAFSPDGKVLASEVGGDLTGEIKLWDVTTGQEFRTLKPDTERSPIRRGAVVFSPDGKHLAWCGPDVKLWDVSTGTELRSLQHSLQTSDCDDGRVAFHPDGKALATTCNRTIKLWDISTGTELSTLTLNGRSTSVNSLAFSPDGKLLAAALGDYTIKIWIISAGKELCTLTGHTRAANSILFSPDSKSLVSGSSDTSIKLWNISSGEELASLVSLDEKDWVVVTPEGRFDASPSGMQLTHWAVGNEVVEFSQLKDRYYEPGLLAKITGFNKEPLRDVSAFKEVKLFPSVEYEAPTPGSTKLNIKLTDRGGGIGKMRVSVNGKEVASDARSLKTIRQASVMITTVDLAGAPIVPGVANTVEVVAWNAEGYLSSRPVRREWVPRGEAAAKAPELYAIVGGISKYASPDFTLRFAAKDAQDIAKAIEIGAKRLFGIEKVHLTLLSTSNNSRAIPPTKANFRKAFEAARKAKPWDILVVYLAGHAAALPGGKDIYCYLTQEARSPNLNDPAIRSQTTITSDELVEWIKQIPALKQVMVLDTCQAGTAATKLMEKRAVPSDQIRAIERLKDRTGFHILMGSAADASSYEASQYGQGLLTYSLLQGMRGAALRDSEYVDVSKLFQYAADQVPQLARNIGGIQKPLIAAPRGTSFDIGQLNKEDKESVPLAMVMPMILRPVFLNPEQGFDNLELIALVRKRLQEESYASTRGGAGSQTAVFVDAEEFPGAIRPSGTYIVDGEKIKANLVLIKDGQRVANFQVEGLKNDPAGLAVKIVEGITEAIRKL